MTFLRKLWARWFCKSRAGKMCFYEYADGMWYCVGYKCKGCPLRGDK